MDHPRQVLQSRRQWLSSAGLGFGSLALSAMLADDMQAASPAIANPLQSKDPHFPAKAKRVIFLFMAGGPSQVETFDPKPTLNKLHKQPVPDSFGEVQTQQTTEKSLLLGSKRTFSRFGESGALISDLFPNLTQHADDLAIVRSLHADSIVHSAALYQMNSGRTLMGHPTVGSWINYGLGTVNQNLPGYVVMLDPDGTLVGGPPCWGAGYFPPVFQGTLFRPDGVPILDLLPHDKRSRKRQRNSLDLLNKLNGITRRSDDQVLLSRLATYELAFRMQMHAPEVIDVSQESKTTHTLYGTDNSKTADFGTRCLMARRLLERGVRFVQLYSGGGPGNLTWDGHSDIEENHTRMAAQVDQPIAALISDLKQRGLFDSTLIIWGGEFGRTPMSQGETGRDHSPFGFSMWLAGGGIKGGVTVGGTDEIGLRAIENPYHVRDLHATILHQLGLDQHKLSFLHNGREEILTDIGGNVISEII